MLFLLISIGGFVPGYPLAQERLVTQDPADHWYTDHENWDVDCVIPEGVGAMVSGTVEVAVFDQPPGDRKTKGYGNQVCIREAVTGYLVCQNHLNQNSLKVTVGDEVRLGDHVADCGNSGHVWRSFDADGVQTADGSHLDLYVVDREGKNVDLAHPNEWTPLATLAEATKVDPVALEAEVQARKRELDEALEFGQLQAWFFEKHEEDSCDTNYDWRESGPTSPSKGDSALELLLDSEGRVHRATILSVSQSGDTVKTETWLFRADGTPLAYDVFGVQYNDVPPSTWTSSARASTGGAWLCGERACESGGSEPLPGGLGELPRPG